MMGGQYLVAWAADYNDPIADSGEGSMAKLLSYCPSKVRPISANCFMRIPIQTTQKWYYLKGSEDSDTEYGKLFLAVASPLANVTGTSSTSLIIRIRWCFELSFPELPESLDPIDNAIYASAPNYFTDSSNDWKSGKYLTFKWHEGGNITEFPNATSKTIYKLDAKSTCQYYATNGTLTSTKYAVCVTEQTETNLPMLAPVENLEKAKAYVKNPSDSYLLSYYSQGPWVYPDNPPWFAQSSSMSLVLTRHETKKSPAPTTGATFNVYDASSSRIAGRTQKTLEHLLNPEGSVLDPSQGALLSALVKLGYLSFEKVPGVVAALATFNFDPVRESVCSDPTSGRSYIRRPRTPSDSSFDEVSADGERN